MDGELRRDDITDAQAAHRRADFASIDATQSEIQERLNGLEDIVNIFGFCVLVKFKDAIV